MVCIGLALLTGALVFAGRLAFERTGLIEKAFGWHALRQFVGRTWEAFAADWRLGVVAAVGVFVLIVGLRMRR